MRYPDSGYSEDRITSVEYDRAAATCGSRVGRSLRLAACIFWLPWVLSFFGVIRVLPQYVFLISMMLGLMVFIGAMVKYSKSVSKVVSRCSRCHGSHRRYSLDSCDFYVCDDCRLYVRGGDFS